MAEKYSDYNNLPHLDNHPIYILNPDNMAVYEQECNVPANSDQLLLP